MNYKPKHVLFQIKETKCLSLWLVRGEPLKSFILVNIFDNFFNNLYLTAGKQTVIKNVKPRNLKQKFSEKKFSLAVNPNLF